MKKYFVIGVGAVLLVVFGYANVWIMSKLSPEFAADVQAIGAQWSDIGTHMRRSWDLMFPAGYQAQPQQIDPLPFLIALVGLGVLALLVRSGKIKLD